MQAGERSQKKNEGAAKKEEHQEKQARRSVNKDLNMSCDKVDRFTAKAPNLNGSQRSAISRDEGSTSTWTWMGSMSKRILFGMFLTFPVSKK